MEHDRYDNQKLAEKLVYHILEHYSQKIIFDPDQLEKLQPNEREWIRKVWQGDVVEVGEASNKELEKVSDNALAEILKNYNLDDNN